MTDSPTTSSGAAGQALYRRFRAQTFSQIVGQDAVVQTLRNAVRLERVGQSSRRNGKEIWPGERPLLGFVHKM